MGGAHVRPGRLRLQVAFRRFSLFLFGGQACMDLVCRCLSIRTVPSIGSLSACLVFLHGLYANSLPGGWVCFVSLGSTFVSAVANP